MYHVYLLKCRDGSLYTGIAKNLNNRLKLHNQGRASKYTRSKLPVVCLYSEKKRTINSALRREIEIKKFNRSMKLKLIGKKTPK